MEDARETEATLAKTLKTLRTMDGYTQEDVARAIGTSVTNISHWETGLKVPRPEWLTALAKLYGVEVGNLFGVKVEKQAKRKRK
jgi:transcriptional regulator with XRE-family HTH domain